MKLDLSFHLLKNSLAFHMKKGFNNPCTGDTSTSTLEQQQLQPQPQPTLEEMIMQLDLDASRPSLQHHRMSCVNSSDILQSARNALSQYPRFSLDGKDAMYRSSFRKFDQVTTTRPSKVAGERVIWCKPGIVGKLMGLEAMPVPVRLKSRMMMSTCLLRKQNLRRSSERQVVERRKVDSNRVSCSRATTTSGYNKPIAVEMAPARDGGRRFP